MASSDAVLLEKWIVARDADAFAEIVSRYSAMVYSTCKRVIGNPNDAEDVAQECFIELVRVRKTIRPSLGGWLHTVATRRSLDRIKAETRRKRREVRFAEKVDMSTETTWDDIKAHIDEAIAALPEKLREPIIYRFLKGQTQNAIARNLGVSDSTVQYRLSKAIEEMRKFLKRRGVVAPVAVLGSLLGTQLTAEAAPATLTAALGKLTLAGATGAVGVTVGTSATSIAALGGVLVMKKLILSGIVLTCAIGGFVLTRQWTLQEPAAPVEMTTMQDRHEAPRERAGLAAEPPRAVRVHESTTGVRVTGKVIDFAGNPVEAAIVKLFQRGSSKGETLTGTDGTFEFRGVRSWGAIAVLAEKENMCEMPSSRDLYQLTESGLQDILITLHYTAAVEGVVVDPWNRPVSGKEVTARWINAEDTWLPESAVTSGQGAFRIAGLLPGSHSLAVIPEKAGRIDIEDVRVELEEGEHRTGIRIVYEGDGLVIAGRVINEASEPVKDALVQVGIGDVTSSAHTDEDGRYRLTRLPEGVWTMAVYHSDYESVLEAGIEAGREDVDFVLVALPSEGVTGRVIDADTREPITDFWITQRTGAWQGRTWSRGRHRVDFRHDEQGRFWLKEVRAKEITIVADAVGYAPGYAAVHMAEGERTPEVIIPLSRGHVLEGTVVTTENDPVPGAYIFVDDLPRFDAYRDNDDFANVMTASRIMRSEADGSFLLDNLEEGIPTTVVAYHLDHGLGVLELTPSGAETTGVKIVLTRGGQIAGTVTLAGEPLAGARVGVWHDGLQTNVGQAETEADGSYVLPDVPEGTVDVFVQLPGSFPPYSRRAAHQYDILVQNGRTTHVPFDYPAGNSRLEGSVTLFGEPVERGDVTLRASGPAGTEQSGRSIGINGRYVFRDVPAGPATLSVGVRTETGDWITRTINVEITEGEVTTVDIDMSGNSVVGGYVYGLGPFERGGVRVLSGEVDIREFTPNTLQELAPFLQGHSVVAYDGAYEIQGLEPGVYTLVAIATPRTLHGGYDHARFATTVLNLQENQEINLDFDLN